MGGVVATHDLAARAEPGQHPAAGVRRPAGQAHLETGDARAQLDRGQPLRPVPQHLQHRGAGLRQPARGVGDLAGGGEVLGQPRLLGLRDPGRRAAPRRAQQVAREHEQGAAHRQLAHQAAVDVQRAVEAGGRLAAHPLAARLLIARGLVDAGVHREVHRGRLGGVQRHHGPGRAHRVADPVGGGDRVPPRQPCLSLRRTHLPHDTHPATDHGRSATGCGWRGAGLVGDVAQLVVRAVSSTTKLVPREESSVPTKRTVTLLPVKAEASRVRVT